MGNYAVIVTLDGCEKTSACYEVTTLSTDKLEQFSLNIYPNPSNGNFTVVTSQATSIKVVDAVGKVIYQATIKEGSNHLQLEDTMNGVYFIQFNDGNTQHIKRLVINK
jgi:hypothetical protein